MTSSAGARLSLLAMIGLLHASALRDSFDADSNLDVQEDFSQEENLLLSEKCCCELDWESNPEMDIGSGHTAMDFCFLVPIEDQQFFMAPLVSKSGWNCPIGYKEAGRSKPPRKPPNCEAGKMWTPPEVRPKPVFEAVQPGFEVVATHDFTVVDAAKKSISITRGTVGTVEGKPNQQGGFHVVFMDASNGEEMHVLLLKEWHLLMLEAHLQGHVVEAKLETEGNKWYNVRSQLCPKLMFGLQGPTLRKVEGGYARAKYSGYTGGVYFQKTAEVKLGVGHIAMLGTHEDAVEGREEELQIEEDRKLALAFQDRDSALAKAKQARKEMKQQLREAVDMPVTTLAEGRSRLEDAIKRGWEVGIEDTDADMSPVIAKLTSLRGGDDAWKAFELQNRHLLMTALARELEEKRHDPERKDVQVTEQDLKAQNKAAIQQALREQAMHEPDTVRKERSNFQVGGRCQVKLPSGQVDAWVSEVRGGRVTYEWRENNEPGGKILSNEVAEQEAPGILLNYKPPATPDFVHKGQGDWTQSRHRDVQDRPGRTEEQLKKEEALKQRQKDAMGFLRQVMQMKDVIAKAQLPDAITRCLRAKLTTDDPDLFAAEQRMLRLMPERKQWLEREKFDVLLEFAKDEDQLKVPKGDFTEFTRMTSQDLAKHQEKYWETKAQAKTLDGVSPDYVKATQKYKIGGTATTTSYGQVMISNIIEDGGSVFIEYQWHAKADRRGRQKLKRRTVAFQVAGILLKNYQDPTM